MHASTGELCLGCSFGCSTDFKRGETVGVLLPGIEFCRDWSRDEDPSDPSHTLRTCRRQAEPDILPTEESAGWARRVRGRLASLRTPVRIWSSSRRTLRWVHRSTPTRQRSSPRSWRRTEGPGVPCGPVLSALQLDHHQPRWAVEAQKVDP